MSSNIQTLYDRAEGYGHTLGTSTAKDDGTWTGAVPTAPADPSESLATRVARTLTGRKKATTLLNFALLDRASGYGHLGSSSPTVAGAGAPSDGTLVVTASDTNAGAVTGSNTALAVSASNANRDVDATYATSAAPTVTHVYLDGGRIADRTSDWGHTNGAANLHD